MGIHCNAFLGDPRWRLCLSFKINTVILLLIFLSYLFSSSVSVLRKLILCFAESGNVFDVTYNTNKSYCMVIDYKP